MNLVTFEVLSSAGAVIHTFDDRRRARQWADEHRDVFPGLRMERVEVVTTRLRLWTDRVRECAA